jgi:hypothetical protein
VQYGTPRRCSIGSSHDAIPAVEGTRDSLGFGSEAPPQSLPAPSLLPTGAPESTGSSHCAPHLPSNDHCHALAMLLAAYELCPRTLPILPPNPMHAGHTNSPSRGRRDRKRNWTVV